MNPIKILLVDDSKSARYALRLQLQRHATEVETADCAETALERIKESPPDAVFMDHTMPGMNGFEALEILKGSAQTAHIPVIMCTSNEDPDFIAQAHRKGALDVLAKSTAPDKLPALLERVRQVLEDTGAEPTAGPRVGAPMATLRTVVAAAREEAGSVIREQLATTLDERIRTMLSNRLDEEVNQIKADLLAQARIALAERFEDEAKRLQKHVIAVQSEQAQLSAHRLVNEVLPQTIDRQLELERQNLARMVQELIDRSLDERTNNAALLRGWLDRAEAAAARTAEDVVMRHARELEDQALSQRARLMADGMTQGMQGHVRTTYVLAGIAAMIGIAAAGLVYLTLS